MWSDAAAKTTVSGMSLRNLGAAYLAVGDRVRARECFEQALQRKNSEIGRQNIQINLGTIAMQSGDLPAAERHYREALEVATSADALFSLGLVIFERGGRTPAAAREAIGLYKQAEELNPHDPDVQAALGQAWLVLRDEPRARLHLRRALELGVREESAEGIRSYLSSPRSVSE